MNNAVFVVLPRLNEANFAREKHGLVIRRQGDGRGRKKFGDHRGIFRNLDSWIGTHGPELLSKSPRRNSDGAAGITTGQRLFFWNVRVSGDRSGEAG